MCLSLSRTLVLCLKRIQGESVKQLCSCYLDTVTKIGALVDQLKVRLLFISIPLSRLFTPRNSRESLALILTAFTFTQTVLLFLFEEMLLRADDKWIRVFIFLCVD